MSDAPENLAKSSTRGFPKPEQTSLPLKQTDLYYDKERRDFFVKSDMVEEQPVQLFNEAGNSVKEVDKQQTSVKYAQRSEVDNQDDEHDNLNFRNKTKINKMTESLDNEESSTFPELDYLGQMHGTYLSAQGNGGLYIINQHAARERAKYEYYREKIDDVDGSLQ